MGAEMDDEGPSVKKRRINKDDWSKVEKFIHTELSQREQSSHRKAHEVIWKEVDRQLKMQPMQRITADGQVIKNSWNSAFELGELSKVSEVLSADARRIIFPMERMWFESHAELEVSPDPKSEKQVLALQKKTDGGLRSFMSQQHVDFGFKAAFDKSIKESLHHGSFVAEVEFQKQMMVYDGANLALIGAPCWIAHSMWNCYPDESPSVEGTAMFYTGSMIIRKYLPLYKLKQMKGDGWMPGQFHKIKKQENKNGEVVTNDVELIVYYGDINIERQDGDIYLPNSKAITANGTIVYYKANELPFPSIIFGGYEKQDPRDPYYTSPLIKQSPIQKIATILANKYIDAISLRVEPPIVYDGNDPHFVQSDGPIIEPGVKTPSKGSVDFKEIKIGEPDDALKGLQMCLHQLQEGTGVNAVRSGVSNSDRQTATEVQKVAQGGEVRTIDFIDKLNAHLRSFLYMQHELNKKHCDKYSFYSSELGTSDFIRIKKKDIPKNVHFDVVGAKGVLGEEQRAARTSAVVAFASGNPLFAPLLAENAPELLLEMFQDAGNKNPERFVSAKQPQAQIPPQVQMQMQQMQEALQKCQEELQKTTLKLQDKSMQDKIKLALAKQGMKINEEEHDQDMSINQAEAQQKMRLEMQEFMLKMQNMVKEAEAKRSMMKRKTKITKGKDGKYLVEDE